MKMNRTLKLTGILLLGVMLVSACTQSYSQTPLGTPSLLPTGLFVSPFPSGQDPLQIIADLGTQTAQAQTAAAGGATVAVNGTPGTETAATNTPRPAALTHAAQTAAAGSGAVTLLPVPVTLIPGGNTFTPGTQVAGTVVAPTIAGTAVTGPIGAVPASYTLQKGEWPYCIARRFNVNPDELLSLNGLTSAQSSMLMPGRVLSIPRSGGAFPADRAWHHHPDKYTVSSSDTTIPGVACYYGDLDPQSVATANNLSVSSALTSGQVLNIP